MISFFFLGCAPCLVELPGLNALQRRYQRDKLLVADVTSYKVNSYLEPPTHTAIEGALNKTRHKKAPDLTMVVTTDEALKNYNLAAFPVVVILDKASRVRYVGSDIWFEEDGPPWSAPAKADSGINLVLWTCFRQALRRQILSRFLPALWIILTSRGEEIHCCVGKRRLSTWRACVPKTGKHRLSGLSLFSIISHQRAHCRRQWSRLCSFAALSSSSPCVCR